MFWIVCFVVAVAIFVWWRGIKRGQRFARAVDYLTMLDAGATPEEANEMAMQLFARGSDADTERRAVLKANQMAAHAGGQLVLIQAAKHRGFVG